MAILQLGIKRLKQPVVLQVTAASYNQDMRITQGKVVGGQIVVEGEAFTEGATVTVLVSDERTFTLSAEEEAALLEAIAEADRGELLPADEVLKQLP